MAKKFSPEMLKPLIAKVPAIRRRLVEYLDTKYGNKDGKLNIQDLVDKLKGLSDEEIERIITIDDKILDQLEAEGIIRIVDGGEVSMHLDHGDGDGDGDYDGDDGDGDDIGDDIGDVDL